MRNPNLKRVPSREVQGENKDTIKPPPKTSLFYLIQTSEDSESCSLYWVVFESTFSTSAGSSFLASLAARPRTPTGQDEARWGDDVDLIARIDVQREGKPAMAERAAWV